MSMSALTRYLSPLLFIALCQLALIPECLAVPQGTAFTYQGRLDDNGQAASGNHDFEFRLFGAATGGTQLALQSRSNVAVVDGVFSAQLDFGDMGGEQRWLQISVRPSGGGSFELLTPRQPIDAAPYASRALVAQTAEIANSVAANSVSGNSIINGSVGGADVDNSQVQLRINGICAPGFAIREILIDGSVLCEEDDVGTGGGGGSSKAVNEESGVSGGGSSGDVTHDEEFAGSGSASTIARSDHQHFGQSWSGSAGNGLSVTNANGGGSAVFASATAASGSTNGILGQNSSTGGNGVSGQALATSGAAWGVYGRSLSTSGSGVHGLAGATSGTNHGVYGAALSPDGFGGHFQNDATGGMAVGLYGRSESGSGRAVYGFAPATSGVSHGVYGETASSSGNGVGGYATASNGPAYGLFGRSDSVSGIGVDGFAAASSGVNIGVRGVSQSGSGIGGLFTNTSGSGAAVGLEARSSANTGTAIRAATSATTGANVAISASAVSPEGRAGHFVNTYNPGAGISAAYSVAVRAEIENLEGAAVYGIANHALTTSGILAGVRGQSNSPNGRGIEGIAASTAAGATSVGVYGATFGSGPNTRAGFFLGDTQVTGTLIKSGGSFRIDHPLDPEHQYLSHSFVESPEMMNIYNGIVETDAEGTAEVILPDWFEALNQTFRYQLTVLKSFARATVWEEIEGNRFVIRTDEPGIRVSWQVTGVRHDRWAQAHRIPVEQDKPANDQGKFLHPDLWGKGAEHQIGPKSVDRPRSTQ
ncbi:MAG: hypothetical protein KDI48_00670 [Xanthomonadales bacterium]|nr:hypothetical protein [Xanthomonadales bacterium]